jgi:hypothetical protein
MKKGWLYAIIGVLIIILLWVGCSKSKPCTEVTNTVTTKDTTPVVNNKKDTSKPVLVKSTPPPKKTAPTKPNPQPLIIYDTTSAALRHIIDSFKHRNDSLELSNYNLASDNNELTAILSTQNEYWDLIYLDSAKKSYVLLKDTIADNSVIGRGYEFHWEYDQINTTTTTTKIITPRVKALIGLSLISMKDDIFNGAGVSLGLQTKKNKIILLSVNKLKGYSQPVYQATYIVPISLRKK